MHASIKLLHDACTSCDLCVKQCPDNCITLEAHNEQVTEEGARRPKTIAVLDDFRIDYATCMYCGICIEVCPFDALEWSEDPVPPTSTRSALNLHL